MGNKRIGVAVSDLTGLYAFPLTTIMRKSISKDIDRINELLREQDAKELIIGLPLSLSGHQGEQANLVKSFGNLLNDKIDTPIYYVDERYSSVQAENKLINAGVSPSRNRKRVDAAAAAIILQSYLDKQVY
jgi:putative Holliday junction resolvase